MSKLRRVMWLALVATLGILVLAIGIAIIPFPAEPATRTPLSEILGIRLGMSEEQAHRRLERIGTRMAVEAEEEEREGPEGEMELWKLDEPRYAWMQIVVGEGHRVRAMRAYVRAGAHPLRYAQIGDLGGAKKLGYTIWEWQVPPRGREPGRQVIARGADSTFAESITIVKFPIESAYGAREKDREGEERERAEGR